MLVSDNVEYSWPWSTNYSVTSLGASDFIKIQNRIFKRQEVTEVSLEKRTLTVCRENKPPLTFKVEKGFNLDSLLSALNGYSSGVSYTYTNDDE